MPDLEPAVPRAPSLAEPLVLPSTRRREAYFQEFSERIHDSVNVPLMVTGGYRTMAGMQQAFEAGIELIGLARLMILNVELPRELLTGSARVERLAMRPSGPRMIRAVAEIAWYTKQSAAARPDSPGDLGREPVQPCPISCDKGWIPADDRGRDPTTARSSM